MRLIPNFNAVTDSFKDLMALRKSNPVVDNFLNNYLSYWEFDEDWYLRSNSDLADAIPSENFRSGFAHFQAAGYFEGRLPIPPHVDADWYMSHYPDVAHAVIKGVFSNPVDHFMTIGYREGRLPGKPKIDVGWYARTYLGSARRAANYERCLDHFISIGYLNGALPRIRCSF